MRAKSSSEDMSQSADQQRFGHAGDTFDQSMIARENNYQSLIDYIRLADNDFGHFFAGLGKNRF